MLAARYPQSNSNHHKLQWQASPGNKLLASRAIAPIPGHVQVGGVDGNEERDERVAAPFACRRPQNEPAHNDFGKTAGVGPKAVAEGEPRGNDVVKEARRCKMHDSGQGNKTTYGYG